MFFVKFISRRDLLKIGGASLGITVARSVGWGQRSGQDDDLQRWIEQTAVRINPNSDDNWSDQVIAAIGSARIVMLGEPSHGAGAAFTAKARIVEVLHERLGFDVLVWESGLIDLERTEAGLAAELDPVEAAQRGILKIWSASAECRPLFAYAKASHRGPRPLIMAGFDMQLTAPGTLEYFSAELRAFVGTLSPKNRDRAKELADQILNHFGRLNRYTDALADKLNGLGSKGVTGPAQAAAIEAWNKSDGDALRPVPEDLHRLQQAADALVPLLRKSAASRAGFMVRAVTSLAGYGANLVEQQGKHSDEDAARFALTSENRRDQINAENLKWLIDTAYSGRKIMVWAHNAHVMNAWYSRGFDSVSLQPLSDGMKPMGVWLTNWYGDSLYRIGWTAYQGSDGWVGAPPSAVPVAASSSLESRIHRLGAPEAFLPLRSAPSPVSMRIPKYTVETISKPDQAFNALYFIDTMKPATLL